MIVSATSAGDYGRLKISEQPPLSGCAIIMILLIRNPMKIDIGNETRRIALRIAGNHTTCVEVFTGRRTERLLNVERLLIRKVRPSEKKTPLSSQWLKDVALVAGL